MLLKEQADPNGKDSDGQTALMLASKQNHEVTNHYLLRTTDYALLTTHH